MDQLDIEFVRDMLRHAELAQSLAGTTGAAELMRDERTYLAVRHAMQIIGEAANQVSGEARAALPDVPWSRLVGMRHHLVHGYRGVRAEILVRTIRENVPGLIASLRRALGDTA